MGNEDYNIYGRNAVMEALRAGKVVALKTRARFANDPLVKEARSKGVRIEFVDDNELDRLAHSGKHQGFVARSEGIETVELSDILRAVKGKNDPLLLMLDGIEDPANLGAIIRSADAFGVDGIIVKSRGSVSLTGAAAKVSTGAVAYVPVAVVPNLSQAISECKDAGFWVVASDGGASLSYEEVNYHGPILLIIGSEGFGISRLVLERSDYIVKIPMVGHVNSLNASVATGVFLSYILLARKR